MSNIVPKTDGYDLIKTSDIVGDHLKFVKHEFLRGGRTADPASRYAMLMNSASTGSISWKDGAIADIQARLVTEAGISDVLDGYDPYTSILMADENGVICTFTSSSWGGRNAYLAVVPQFRLQGKRTFPVVVLESKASGNQYGTIVPVFRIVGWAPRSQFAAITGDADETPAIAAPEQKAGPAAKRTSAEIIDDDIPF